MKTISIICGFVAAILIIFLTYKWKEINGITKGIVIFLCIATTFESWVKWDEYKKEKLIKNIEAKFGQLDNNYDSPIPFLVIGNNTGATFGLSTGIFGYNPFGPLLKMKIYDGKLLINTIIRDTSGKPVAVIEDADWTVYNDDYEYNNDDYAFELVTKGDRKVYFQIELINGVPNVSGHLLTKDGYGLILYNAEQNGQQGGAMYVIVNDSSKATIPQDLDIKRIFKYPRGKYYSERL